MNLFCVFRMKNRGVHEAWLVFVVSSPFLPRVFLEGCPTHPPPNRFVMPPNPCLFGTARSPRVSDSSQSMVREAAVLSPTQTYQSLSGISVGHVSHRLSLLPLFLPFAAVMWRRTSQNTYRLQHGPSIISSSRPFLIFSNSPAIDSPFHCHMGKPACSLHPQSTAY